MPFNLSFSNLTLDGLDRSLTLGGLFLGTTIGAIAGSRGYVPILGDQRTTSNSLTVRSAGLLANLSAGAAFGGIGATVLAKCPWLLVTVPLANWLTPTESQEEDVDTLGHTDDVPAIESHEDISLNQ